MQKLLYQKEILKKNYKEHLKTSHPNEDKDDPSGFDQKRIASMFPKLQKKDENVDVDNIGEKSKRKIESESSDKRPKKRHESGDSTEKKRHESGDSGFGDSQKSKSDNAVMIPPPLLSSNVSNNELGAKLDSLILSVEELKLASHGY